MKLLLVLTLLHPAIALLQVPAHHHETSARKRTFPRSSSSIRWAVSSPPAGKQQDSSSTSSSAAADLIRNDIEEMRRQAQDRFHKLSIQMEELKERKRKQQAETDLITNLTNQQVSTTTSTPTREIHHPSSLDGLEGDLSKQHKELQEVENELRRKSSAMNGREDSSKNQQLETTSSTATPTRTWSKDVTETINEQRKKNSKFHSIDLLDDTRWKIVFSIGREAGTWMPPTWGISGDRVLFQVEVDFTSIPLYDQDDFFQGPSGTKKLDVVEAFLIPRGVGNQSVGRRPVPCKSSGGYKVCKGQGPMGTDLVRLYIELLDDVTIQDHESDVYCPKGRIYATCGYFVIQDSREIALSKTKSAKEIAMEAHKNAVLHQELIQNQIDSDTRLLSVEKLKLMKELYSAKNQVDETIKQIHIARQREPDKSHLRLSKKGNVGLSRDGGVCCKVQKGLALEYHILGRMEIGCVDDHQHHHQ